MNLENPLIQKLIEKKLISDEQQKQIKIYQSLGIFSLRTELLFLLYLSVLMFSSGVGILIYKNIDTIGHSILILLLFALIGGCYYFSFKKYSGFTKNDTDFENPVYNYLVLLATILSCSFMGYVQYQYHLFGTNFEIPILIAAFIALGTAYYFNNKSALSIGLTALATSIGISLTPQTLIENDVYWDQNLCFYGLILGLLLGLWAVYSKKIGLKKHFDLVLITFTLHLIGICTTAGLINDYWYLFVFILGGSSFYFYNKSFEIPSISVYIFTLLYGYFGVTIFLFRLISLFDFWNIFTPLFFLLPAYFIGSIVLFIQAIKKFNTKTNDHL